MARPGNGGGDYRVSDEANLDAYLKRINYAGSIAPTLETLEMVHRLHPAAIPFENLNPLMELPVRLQLSDLEQKLMRRAARRLLLRAQSAAQGRARSRWTSRSPRWPPACCGGTRPAMMPPQLNHMVLLVDVDGVPYLADVGFGGQVLTAPLRLRADVEQQTPDGRYPPHRRPPDMAARKRDRRRRGTPLYRVHARRRAALDDFVAMNDVAMRRLPRRSHRRARRGQQALRAPQCPAQHARERRDARRAC